MGKDFHDSGQRKKNLKWDGTKSVFILFYSTIHFLLTHLLHLSFKNSGRSEIGQGKSRGHISPIPTPKFSRGQVPPGTAERMRW